MFRKIKTLLAAASLLLAGSALAADIKELSFGIIATEKAGALRQMWEPFLDDMSKAVGVKVNGFYATDYAGIIEGQRFNKVQVAWYGNKSAIDAVDRANGEVFAQFVDLDGTPGYYSYLIAHKDSGIQSLEQVLKNGKDYSFGIGDPSSTSGNLVPTYYVFTRNNLDPKTHFKVTRASNHEGNFLAVLNRQVDVATTNSELTLKMKEKSPEKLDQIRILWTSPLIPRDPLVWRKDLPADIKKKIQDFVVGYGKNEREKEILKNMYRLAGFRASTDAQLVPIRQLELFKDRKKFESDANMDETERKQKLADIDGKLAELARQLK
ncbi:phosphonate ABC transporter substrate-binding protein [Zoogloea sp.]|uniref:phosphonate ABC transporter substrate-binding protein n=1 Tax=Zoogloea sp. TaxID=49181 RepID=UPI001AD45884|nr:phosphonate ABC transporter substrate-binding protein [Zoogloea sp.]MBN8285443.1 phosphonate ABC transporter substrate-binding protein [Zoogloea sp.]